MKAYLGLLAATLAGCGSCIIDSAAAAPRCIGLAATANANSSVISATSTIVAASGGTPAHCQVDLLVRPVTKIRVGLPLSRADGGSGGIQGAWNGKIQNLGGGVYQGTINPVTGPVTAGYVGSHTDTGHNADWCNEINPQTGFPNSYPCPAIFGAGFVLDPSDNSQIDWQVEEFITRSLLKQTRWALTLTQTYYGKSAERNYWNGCSTGGRQGFEMAQKYGHLFDGFLVGAPAMAWNRFVVGYMWPSVVINQYLGPAGLPPSKYNAANDAARAACDRIDGVADGIVNEPRLCKFDARQLICQAGQDPSTCLLPIEAVVVNQIWKGPVNMRGQKLWGGIPRGTSFAQYVPTGLGTVLSDQYMRFWVERNPNFEWPAQMTMENFPQYFQKSTRTFRDGLAETFSTDLDVVRRRNAKIIHYHGVGDDLIPAFGSWKYASEVMQRYGVSETQSFMRSFFFPDNGHCGGGPAGTPLIDSGRLFKALENWVENDVAPDYVVARSSDNARSRKICMYPNEARYKGRGDTDRAASFLCKVNDEEPTALARDSVTAKLYREAP